MNGLAPLFPRVEQSVMTDPSQYVRERHNDGRRDVRWPDAPEPLAVPVYDNHAHLEIADGDEPLSLDEQLDRAAAVGVIGVVQAGGDIDSSRWSAWAAASHPRVLAAVAIHPNEAPAYEQAGELDAAIAVIDELAAQPRVRAIGETGLDFFRTGEDGFPAQFRAFEAHIALAKKHGIAMQIHDRDAHDAVLETLRARRRARPHRVPLLLGRRRDGADRRRARLLPVVRGQRDVQERAEPARRARGDAARADPGRDGCAVPHADPASGPARTRRTSCR